MNIDERCHKLSNEIDAMITAHNERCRALAPETTPQNLERERIAGWEKINAYEVSSRAEIEQSEEFRVYLSNRTAHASRERLLVVLVELARDFCHAGPGGTLDSVEAVSFVVNRLKD